MSISKQFTYSPSSTHTVSTNEREYLTKLAHDHFGYDTVYEYQLLAVSSMLNGIDSSVIVGTGLGKSLCYALAALASRNKLSNKKMVVVISPLITLMKDQSDTFNHAGIKTCFINSEQNDAKLVELAKAGEMELVFISPEAVTTTEWMNLFKSKKFFEKIVGIAFDEAYTLYQWSSFRESVSKLIEFRYGRTKANKVPIMVLTATPTEEIIYIIYKTVGFNLPHNNVVYIRKPLDRPNIYFEVRKKSTFKDDMLLPLSFIHSDISGIMIIYCRTINMLDSIVEHLRENVDKDTKQTIKPFHSLLSSKYKEDVLLKFKSGENLKVVVATDALGMGVDTSHVHSVIIYSPPLSLVEFSQQSGRAGRDGKPAASIIFFSSKDLNAEKPAVKECMKNFIEKSNSCCLRLMLLQHLGESLNVERLSNTRCCGYCNGEDIEESIIFGTSKVKSDSNLQDQTNSAPKKKQIPMSKNLKKTTKKALEDFRRKKISSLPEGALIHGPDTVIFGEASINKIIEGMKAISTGEDVLKVCDGMVCQYADEIAAIVCDLKAKDEVSKKKK